MEMTKPILSALLAIFILFINLNASLPSDPLDKFLNSAERSERKAAYLDILQNKEAYIDQIQKELETFQRTKDRRFNILNRLLYLAAIIRSEKFIDPLWKMFNDFDYLWHTCIYCCPIDLTLTLYATYTTWSPPNEIFDTRNDMTVQLQEAIRREKGSKDIPLIREHSNYPYGSPEHRELMGKMELLSVEDLIKMAGPENPDLTQRSNATYVLGLVVIDDKNLTELYWLAIEAPHDVSGIYLCNVYWAIERAERARAQKGVHIH
jgi:hypothetical protein